MTIITQILTPERTLCGVRGPSKKKILERIAELISEEVPAINAKDLFNALVVRERLGTTGLGKGIAIPHCRIKSCPEPIGLFLQLDEPVDFDAVDREPVDLVFALIVPDGENQTHLQILKDLAIRFQSDERLQKMRLAANKEALYQTFTS